jgi:hypothetical protein
MAPLSAKSRAIALPFNPVFRHRRMAIPVTAAEFVGTCYIAKAAPMFKDELTF